MLEKSISEQYNDSILSTDNNNYNSVSNIVKQTADLKLESRDRFK